MSDQLREDRIARLVQQIIGNQLDLQSIIENADSRADSIAASPWTELCSLWLGGDFHLATEALQERRQQFRTTLDDDQQQAISRIEDGGRRLQSVETAAAFDLGKRCGAAVYGKPRPTLERFIDAMQASIGHAAAAENTLNDEGTGAMLAEVRQAAPVARSIVLAGHPLHVTSEAVMRYVAEAGRNAKAAVGDSVEEGDIRAAEDDAQYALALCVGLLLADVV